MPDPGTRERLIIAAMNEFAEKGFRDPSIHDICKRAGFTRGAFYANFVDRDELIGAVMDKKLSGFMSETIEGDQMGDVPTMIINFVMAATGKAWEVEGSVRWRFHHSLEACAASDPVRIKYLEAVDRMRAHIKAQVIIGQRDGRVRRDVDAGAITGMMVGLAYGGIVMTELGASYDFAPVAAGILQILAPPSATGSA